MRILNIAFALAHVGDDAVGGVEQVVAMLDQAIPTAGHESIVVASEGSRVRGELVATPRQPERVDQSYYAVRYAEQKRAIEKALASGPVDVVHMHGLDFHEFIPETAAPVLVTLHMPPSWYPQHIWNLPGQGLHFNCVSLSQSRAVPAGVPIRCVVPNGVRIPEVAVLPREARSGAVVVGRICPEKGTHLAIAAARTAGLTLSVAGRAFGYPEHLDYFASMVEPEIGPGVKFLGAIGARAKTELLRGAKCLLVPSLAPESSSLVSMEALACGTPVIALRSGALPEIVQHGETGFIVDSVEQMAEAIPWVARIDPRHCRAVAMERFSAGRMTGEYLRIYEQIAAPAYANPLFSQTVAS